MQAALQMDVGGEPAVLGRYYANDEPMQKLAEAADVRREDTETPKLKAGSGE